MMPPEIATTDTQAIEMTTNPQHSTADVEARANIFDEMVRQLEAPTRTTGADKGKERAEDVPAQAGLRSEPDDDVATASAPEGVRAGIVRREALTTINEAVEQLIPHQKATVDQAHRTLAGQRKLLEGIIGEAQKVAQTPTWGEWAGQKVGRTPTRSPDEEAAMPLLNSKVPLSQQQNALGAQAIIDHVDGAQGEFAASSRQAMAKASLQPTENSSRTVPGNRDGAATDMEAAFTQYNIQKSRITGSAGKLVGPASTFDVRSNALSTAQTAVAFSAAGVLGTLIVSSVNAHFDLERANRGS